MSLFQCRHCGCAENTALSGQGCDGYAQGFYDWSGIEEREGLKLCSACAPTKHADGTPTQFGQWHGRFARTFLPMGMFRTARNGNLEHRETGDQNYHAYAIPEPQTVTLSTKHLEDALEQAFINLVEADVEKALILVTGMFVGLTKEYSKRRGYDTDCDIKIDGGTGRDITIHKPKQPTDLTGCTTTKVE
jgi:hypothetical protein